MNKGTGTGTGTGAGTCAGTGTYGHMLQGRATWLHASMVTRGGRCTAGRNTMRKGVNRKMNTDTGRQAGRHAGGGRTHRQAGRPGREPTRNKTKPPPHTHRTRTYLLWACTHTGPGVPPRSYAPRLLTHICILNVSFLPTRIILTDVGVEEHTWRRVIHSTTKVWC